MPLHNGNRQPSRSAAPENDPNSPREGGYRIPRIIADLVAAHPVHLGIVDGIRSMTSGEPSIIRYAILRAAHKRRVGG